MTEPDETPLQRVVRSLAVLLFAAVSGCGPLLAWFAPRAKTLASVEMPDFDIGRLADGSLFGDLERSLRETSPLTYHLRGLYCETLQRIGWLESSTIHFGRSEWWFLSSEQAFPADAFERDAVRRREAYAALHARLEALDVKTLVVLIPDKSRVYRDFLAPGEDYPASREGLYATLLAEFRGAGFAVVDLLTLYEGLRRSEPGTVLWYARDSHWNGAGMAHAVTAVRQELERLGWTARLGAEQGIKPLQARYQNIGGDMLSVLGIRASSDVGLALSEERDQFAYTIPGVVGAAPRSQPRATWALAGTSFSHEGLTTLLPIFVDRAIDAGSVHNGWLPVRLARDVIARIERHEIRPAVLIWEVPERLEVEEPWAEIARELGIR